ncbi:N-acetylmannosamine-6-phosphate 2-epimerase [Ignavibacteriales bacterium]
MNEVFNKIKNGLIVSCQSEGLDPFNTPSGVTLFAKAAQMAGASAIRSQGLAKIRMIKKQVPLPMIGLLKGKFPDGTVKITGSTRQVEQLLGLGCEIIAIDGTFRKRENLTGPEFIKKLKLDYPNLVVMADIATIEEGVTCEASGADCLSTTLSGYTPDTASLPKDIPDFALLESLAKKCKIPVIAEGKIKSPEEAKKMMELGAFAVVVGTVITRPRVVMGWYKDAIKEGTTE